ESYSIRARISIQDLWPCILKSGDMFALFNRIGDVPPAGATPGGIFYNDTRHLSQLDVLLNGHMPLLLSSAVDDDNVLFTIDVSNPDIFRGDQLVLASETLHLRRSKMLWEGTCYERVAIRNFDSKPQSCWLTILTGADFADIFEVRGMTRARHGKITTEKPDPGHFIYRYRGLDKHERMTRIGFVPQPWRLENGEATYLLELPPKGHMSLFMTIECS